MVGKILNYIKDVEGTFNKISWVIGYSKYNGEVDKDDLINVVNYILKNS